MRHTAFRVVLAASLSALAFLGESGVAHAEDAEAVQRYEHGVKLYQSGAFEAALVELSLIHI